MCQQEFITVRIKWMRFIKSFIKANIGLNEGMKIIGCWNITMVLVCCYSGLG